MNEKTLRETGSPTVREQANAAADSAQAAALGLHALCQSLPGGLRLVSRLSAQGSEAELYIVESEGETRVLKLYRPGVRPKQDVQEKYGEIASARPGHVIRIFHSGRDPHSGRWYEIQELASCGSIADWLADGLALDFDAFVRQLAEAVHALHQHGVIHRDLKPGNILVRSASPFELALSDFGVASILDSGLDVRETLHKGFTPMYAAPEDFDGSIVSPAADWWSCGMIFLEALVGRHPFQGLSPARIAYFLATRSIEIDQSLPERQQRLLKGLLTRNDKKRWGWREIQAWLGGREDIPLYYDMPEPACVPFRFLGREFASPQEMALFFASDYEAWQAGRGTLARGNIARWLADCREYEEERIVLEELADADADLYLARFIAHYAPEAPPRVFGMELSAANLLGWLACPGESRTLAEAAALAFIVERKGALGELLAIWSEARVKDYPILAALAGRTWRNPEELRNSLLGLVSPESFYWGPGGAPASYGERLDFMERTPGILTMKSWEEMGGPDLPMTPRIIRLFESGRYNEAIKSLQASKKWILSREDYEFIRQLAREYGLNERWVDFLEKALELINRQVRVKADDSLFASVLERGLDFLSETNIAHTLLRIFVAAALRPSADSPGVDFGWPFTRDFSAREEPFSDGAGPREKAENSGEGNAGRENMRSPRFSSLDDFALEPFASLSRLLEEMGLRRP